jgi:Integrase zinc binding domain
LACQQRQLSYLAEFTSDFQHVPGVDNLVADALSRPGDSDGSVHNAVASELPQPGGGSSNVDNVIAGELPQPGGGSSSVDNVVAGELPQPGGGSSSVSNVVAGELPQPGGGSVDSSTPGAGLTRAATCPGKLDFIRPGPQSSHPATAAVCSLGSVAGVDFAPMTAEQLSCPDCKVMEQSAVLKVKFFKSSHYQLLCDYSTGSPRPLVPASQRKAVFAAIHGVAHPGVRATRRLISTRFVWPKMAADIAAWCRDCVQCNVG